MMALPISWHLAISSWRDLVEITACITAFYHLSAWLHKDKQSPLLATAYTYCTLLIGSYFLELPLLHTALLTFAPLVITALCMLHKETLQKSFVALHRITPATKIRSNWIEDFIQLALVSMNRPTPLQFVIEKNGALDPLIASAEKIDAPFSAGLAKLLLHYQAASKSCLWIARDGTVCGYDCTFMLSSIDAWLSKEVAEHELWIQEALVISTKVDALFIQTDPASRTFTLIRQGEYQRYVSAKETLQHIMGHLEISVHQEQGERHEHAGYKKRTIEKFQS